MNKTKLVFASVAISVIIVTVIAFGLITQHNHSKSASELKEAQNLEITEKEETNVFFLNSESAMIGDEITITLSLTGNVSICRYSTIIEYDNAVLELVDYDAELSAFSPIVNPEKDDKGNIIGESNGFIGLEWAHATNINKADKIIEMRFKVRDIAVAKTKIEVKVKGVSMLSDSMVVDAGYSVVDSVVTINQ